MAVTLVLAMAVPLVLPARFSIGPPWAVPAVEVLLLVAIIAIDRGHNDRRSAAGRALSLVLVAVLVADAAGVTARLIADLIQGGPESRFLAPLEFPNLAFPAQLNPGTSTSASPTPRRSARPM